MWKWVKDMPALKAISFDIIFNWDNPYDLPTPATSLPLKAKSAMGTSSVSVCQCVTVKANEKCY